MNTHVGAGMLALVAGLVVAPVATGAFVAGLDSSWLSVSVAFEVWAAVTIAAAAALARSLRPLGTLVAVLGALGGVVAYGFIVFPALCIGTYFGISGEGLG